MRRRRANADPDQGGTLRENPYIGGPVGEVGPRDASLRAHGIARHEQETLKTAQALAEETDQI
jgi:hypothetical protein